MPRETFLQLYELVSERSGANSEQLKSWFGQGMLVNVMAAIGAREIDQPWARSLS